MERCIVAPVDGTSFGEHALPLAAGLAKRSGAVLRLAHVHVPLITPSGVEAVAFRGSWNDVAKQQERSYLEALADRISRTFGIRVESSLMEGAVAQALEEYVQGCAAQLVVMSTHAHTRLRRLWHHGVAGQIALDLPIPVLLVHPEREDEEPDLTMAPEIRRILIPLDGSPHAEAMVEHAVALGRPLGAAFTLLRVVRPELAVGYTLLGQDGHLNHHRLEGERTAALQYLNSVAERMRTGGLEVDTQVVASDDPAGAIVGFVHASAGTPEGVDLIAMETHPHRPVARILGAHTADLVLHDSPVPVLLFAPPAAPLASRGRREVELSQPSA
jgi:nucleotide-binding universal stress UspA family protein